jgi:hypothetical protein
MTRVELPIEFSPLLGGRCRLNDDIAAWLRANTPQHSYEIRSWYGSPMQMDSGSDPYRQYTLVFENADDALLFKMRWFGADVS